MKTKIYSRIKEKIAAVKNNSKKFFLKYKKYWPYAAAPAIILGIFFFAWEKTRPLTVGLITDIHAGNAKHRNFGEGNELEPRNYCQNMNKVFKDAKADFYIALGDITLDGGPVEARMASDCAKKAGKEIIWARGNHDDNRAWEELGLPNYYFKDKGDWRIIVLYDSVSDAKWGGGLDDGQIDWLEKSLDTDKKIIIAQHHPLWGTKDNPDTANVAPGINFNKEAEILSRHPNVKYVFSGHTHLDNFCVSKDSYTYCRIYALGLKDHEGGYMKFVLNDK